MNTKFESTNNIYHFPKKWISIPLLMILIIPLQAISAPLWSPGTPCTGGCNIEIIDHSGIAKTSPSSAVFKIRAPEVATSSGPATAPHLEIYNPKLKMIEQCARKIRSIKKPRPGSVRLRASEYKLAGSEKVVFLVKKCGKRPGPPGGPAPHDGPGEGGTCASGDTPPSTSCAETGSDWQSVSNVLSENFCQLGYTDEVTGPGKLVIYDNSYSVTCNGSSYEPSVRVGATPMDSNWGAFNDSSETCRMKTGIRPSDGTRVVEKILCPSVPR